MSIITPRFPPDQEWPASLPQCFLIDKFSYGPVETTLRHTMDAGLAKQRNRYTVAPWLLTGSIVVTLAQKKTLDAWVKDDLLNGSKPFMKVDPWNPLNTWRWRFQAPLTYTPIGDRWKTTLVLDRLPDPAISEDGGFGLVDNAGNHLVDAHSNWLGG